MKQVVRRSCLIASTILLAALVAAPVPPARSGAGTVRVVVRAVSTGRAAAAVRAAGGSVRMELPIIDGVAADLPAGADAVVTSAPGVLAVTPDATVRFAEAASHNPHTVKSVFASETGADQLWKEGVTGVGVRVALIDTGVWPVPDLASRIAPVPDPVRRGETAACVNFSGETTCDDTYGHGTFMAGLIAGSGAASAGRFKGTAPGAQIVSVKIAGRDGSADVSKVLAALQWVVSFSREMNIRVVNLSLGTDSRVSYRFDPLNFAVERAWRSGIAVVVAASNRGPRYGTISKPADDPLVITVGAVDDRETPAVPDDRLPFFSGRGPTADGLAKPDLVAPGGRVVSLRAPGSFIEQQYPGGGIDATYRRGSGTSMAAAVTSGAAALVLDANPSWTPDRLKFALVSTARKVAERDPLGVGAGLVQAWKAARQAPPGLANQDVTVLSDGTGSLDGSRGGVLVTRECDPSEVTTDPDCGRVHGERTAQDLTFDRAGYLSSEWSGSSWYDSQWVSNPLGAGWSGSSWYDNPWLGSSWYGSSWYGSSDNTSYGRPVPGSAWYGAWS